MDLLNSDRQCYKRVLAIKATKQRWLKFNSLKHYVFFHVVTLLALLLQAQHWVKKKAFLSSIFIHSRTLTINSFQVKEQRIGCRMQVTRLMKGQTYCFKGKKYWNQRWTAFISPWLQERSQACDGNWLQSTGVSALASKKAEVTWPKIRPQVSCSVAMMIRTNKIKQHLWAVRISCVTTTM